MALNYDALIIEEDDKNFIRIKIQMNHSTFHTFFCPIDLLHKAERSWGTRLDFIPDEELKTWLSTEVSYVYISYEPHTWYYNVNMIFYNEDAMKFRLAWL